jgi:uncharacterized membrane protein YczE
MRISRWTLLWILIVGVLAAIWIGVFVGSFLVLVYSLVVIAILSIIGAVFVGMWVSHRVLSGQGFTPFEEEMLRMRQEVRELQERLEAIAARLGVPADPRTKAR